MKFTVRALNFRKRFSPTSKDYSKRWVVLGHMDEMDCYCLGKSSLDDIKKHNDQEYKNDNETAYHHVIYLISTDTKSEKEEDELWNNDYNYMAVTRIHFPKAVKHKRQFDILNRHIKNLSKLNDFENIKWNTYYTTELSDMVLVSKSNSFQNLSRWTLLSTNTNFVGDAYTYFCLSSFIILNNKTPDNLANDILDFVSVRFSVIDHSSKDIINQIRNCLGNAFTLTSYAIAGNEDLMICGHKVPMKNMIEFYRFCYNEKNKITHYFREIITQIGADWNSISQDYTDCHIKPCENILIKYSKEISKNVYNNISNTPYLENKEWLRPMVEVTNALVHMSASATLDEPVFLILPAIKTFWTNIFSESDNIQTVNNANGTSNDPMYFRFSELCVHTLEHLMRGEGQLSQQPEVRPLAYDIPVFVLEYATAFLILFNNMINKNDSVSQVSFLLAPSTAKMVSTAELFESTNDTSGLLQITVPFSFLYSPDILLPTLCHELAHYVGEKFRSREIRYNYFLQAVSYEFQKHFFQNDPQDRSSGLQRFFIEKALPNLLVSSCEHSERMGIKINKSIEKLPLSDIVIIILDSIHVFCDYNKYVNLIKDYLLDDKYERTKIRSLDQVTIEERFPEFVDRINHLRVLFRETYADTCMLHFLKISPEKYFDIIIRSCGLLNDGTLVQMYISLITSGFSLAEIKSALCLWGKNGNATDDDITHICRAFEKIHIKINSNDELSEKFLYKYIKQCKNLLNENFPFSHGQDKNEIDKMYREIIDDESSYRLILDSIDKSRSRILDFLNNN